MDWNSGDLGLVPGSSTVLHLLQKNHLASLCLDFHLCSKTLLLVFYKGCEDKLVKISEILKHWLLSNKSPWPTTKLTLHQTKLSSWPDWSSPVLALLLWQLFLHSRDVSMEQHEGMFNVKVCKTALQMEGKEMPLLQARKIKWDKSHPYALDNITEESFLKNHYCYIPLYSFRINLSKLASICSLFCCSDKGGDNSSK